MVMLLIVSGVIMPAFIWLILYCHIIDQYVEAEDGELVMTETKAEAQRYVLSRTIKSPFFWLYIIFASANILAVTIAYDVFGLGWDDWFFSL